MASEIVIHAQQIEMIPLDALRGYDKNSKSHPPGQIEAIANIVRDSGWTTPLLVDDDDVILAGHGRVEVARKLKMVAVPCVRVSGLSEDQRRALRISDNKTPELGSWLDDVLRVELGELRGNGFDLSLTGFGSLELTNLFATQEGQTDPDEVPAAPATPTSQLGDLWRLGEHWLVCGDSTDKATVELVLQGQKPHLMVTDPPYGENYNADWRNHAGELGYKQATMGTGGRAIGKVQNDHRADWREAWMLFPGEVAYVWFSSLKAPVVGASLEAVDFELRSLIVWNKSRMAISRGHYHWKHEPCWYAVRKGGSGHWAGSRKEVSVWDIDHGKSETGHSTQKPVEAMARPMRNNSQPGDRVYDPFMGSGTTIIAAQMNKRIAHGVELDPTYVDVSLARFAAFTGVQPTLVETGETFEAVKGRRLEVV